MGLTDKHLYYGDDIPKTTEKDYFRYIEQLKKEKADLLYTIKAMGNKVGKWKRVSMDKYVQHAMAYYRCSECGKDIIGTHNYCPNCGAKMQEVEE